MFNETVWKDGEKQAQEYMRDHGYNIIYTNFQCVGIELDIVATLSKKIQDKILKEEIKKRKNSTKDAKMKQFYAKSYKNMRKNLTDLLVITEVKARSSDKYGIGAEGVDSTKMYNIKKGADYLLQKPEFAGLQVRFDIASVDSGEVNYIENAFQ